MPYSSNDSSIFCYLIRNQCCMIFHSEASIYIVTLTLSKMLLEIHTLGNVSLTCRFLGINIMYEPLFTLSDNLFALTQVSTLENSLFISCISFCTSSAVRKILESSANKMKKAFDEIMYKSFT